MSERFTTSADYSAHEAATEARYGLEPRRIGGQAFHPDDVPSPSDLNEEA